MANLAQIQSIAQGQFFVKDSLGNLTELKVGDTVSLNDTIVAASSNTDLSKIEILFDTNELITLSQGEQLLDTTLLASTFGNEELAFDKQEVDETLNAWNNAQDGDETDMETAAGDVTEQATNAGDERAADGGALRSKFNSRDGDATDIVSDLREASWTGGIEGTIQDTENMLLEDPLPVVYTIIEGIDVVNEGDSANYVVKLQDAAGNPVIATQDTIIYVRYTNKTTQDGDTQYNNENIIEVVIKAGTSQTEFTIKTNDDYLADNGEIYNVAITGNNSTEFDMRTGDVAGNKTNVDTEILDNTTTNPNEDSNVESDMEQVVLKIVAADKDGNPIKDTNGDYLTVNEVPEGNNAYYVVLAFEPNTTKFNDNTKLDIQSGTVEVETSNKTASGVNSQTKDDGTEDYISKKEIVELGKPISVKTLDDWKSDNNEQFEIKITDKTYQHPSTPVYENVKTDTNPVTTTIKDDTDITPNNPNDNKIETNQEQVILKIVACDSTGNPIIVNGKYTFANEVAEGSNAKYMVLAFHPNTTEFKTTDKLDVQDGKVTIKTADDTAKTTGTKDNAELDYKSETTKEVTLGTVFEVETLDDYLADDNETFKVSINDSSYKHPSTPIYENVKTDTSSVTTTIKDNTITNTETNTEDVKIVLVAVSSATTTIADITNPDGTLKITNTNETPEGGNLYYIAVAVDKDGKPLATQGGYVTINYGTTPTASDKDATAGVDYDNTTKVTTKVGVVFEVKTNDDYYAEGDENFTVKITDLVNSPYETSSIDIDNDKVTSTIKDNAPTINGTVVSGGEDTNSNTYGSEDTVYAIITGETTVNEGGEVVYTVKLVDKDGNTVIPTKETTVTVKYTNNGTTSTDDTNKVNNETITVKIPANGSEGKFTVETKDDYWAEADENYNVKITDVQNTGEFENVKFDSYPNTIPNSPSNNVTTTIKDNLADSMKPDTNTGTDNPDDGNYGKEDTVYVRIVQDSETIEGGNLNHKIQLVDKDGNPVTIPAGEKIIVTLTYTSTDVNDGDFVNSREVEVTLDNSVKENGYYKVQIQNQTKVDFDKEDTEKYKLEITNVKQSNGTFENVVIGNPDGTTGKSVTGTILDGITFGTPVDSKVDEDNFYQNDLNGTDGGNLTKSNLTASESLGITIPAGYEDIVGTYTINFTGNPTVAGVTKLTSDGKDIHFQTIGNKIIAYIGTDVGNDTVNPNNKVFEIVLNKSTGKYDYTQYKNIDHPKAGEVSTEDGLKQNNTLDDIVLNFQFNITTTSKNGQTVTSPSQDFKVTVNDSTPLANNQDLIVYEDNTLQFVLSDGAFKNGKIEIDNNDGNGFKEYSTNDTVTIYEGSKEVGLKEVGTIQILEEGKLEFKPVEDYSKYDTSDKNKLPNFKYKVSDTDGDYAEGKVNIEVKPVADAPTIFVKNIETTEDYNNTQEGTNKIPLGLIVPSLSKDQTDKNNATGDSPERNGEITLTFTNGSAVTGAKIFKSDGTTQVGSDITTAIQPLKVIIVNDTKTDVDYTYHHKGITITDISNPPAGTVYLTKSEYESLKIQHAEDNDTDIKITIKVTSYEVDDSGKPLFGHDTYTDKNNANLKSETTANMIVKIQAVTDDITLNWDSTKVNANIGTLDNNVLKFNTIKENNQDPKAGNIETNELNFGSLLTPTSGAGTDTKLDLDGSEKRSYTIKLEAEAGTTLPDYIYITIGNQKDIKVHKDANGNYKLDFSDANNKLVNPEFKIKFPDYWSGDVTGTITLRTKDYGVDNDPDTTKYISGEADGVKKAEVKFEAKVTSIANIATIQVKQAIGYEDAGRGGDEKNQPKTGDILENGKNGIPLNIKVTSTDKDNSETFTIKISNIPNGGAIHYNGQLLTPETGKDYIEIPQFNNNLELKFIPPHNSHGDFDLIVNVKTIDGNNTRDYTDNPKTTIKVVVKDVADSVVGNDYNQETLVATDADDKVIGIHKQYNAIANEDEAINLESIFKDSTKLASYDKESEDLTIIIKGLPEGVTLTGNVTLINGQYIFKADDISGIKIVTPPNYSGELNFKIDYITTEKGETTNPSKTFDSKTSPEDEDKVSIFVKPTVDAVFKSNTTKAEDIDATTIGDKSFYQLNLGISHQNVDTDETLVSVTINEPTSSEYKLFIKNGDNFEEITFTDGKADISLDNLGKVYVEAPENKHGDFTISGSYTVKDSQNGVGNNVNYEAVKTEDFTHTLTITPVTDKPELKIESINDLTNSEVNGSKVLIKDSTASFKVDTKTTSVDTDKSEKVVKIVISGVPNGVTVNGITTKSDKDEDGINFYEHNGVYVIELGKEIDINGILENLTFNIDGGNFIDRDITITTYTEDSGNGDIKTDSKTINIVKDYGTGSTDPIVLEAKTYNATEDTKFTLKDIFNVSGGQQTGEIKIKIENGTLEGYEKDANGYYIINLKGNAADVGTILSQIKVIPDLNFNDNKGKMEITVDGFGLNNSKVEVPVKPVTDPSEAVITPVDGTEISENGEFKFNINLKNDVDVGTTLEDNVIYIKANETYKDSSETATGKLYYIDNSGQKVYLPTDGKFELKDGYTIDNLPNFGFEAGENRNGDVSITVSTENKEANADNYESATGTTTITVIPVVSSEIKVGNVQDGIEDEKMASIELNVVKADPSEKFESVLIKVASGVAVYYDNGTKLAMNLGDGSWLVPVSGDGKTLPEIFFKGKEHLAGNIDFEAIINVKDGEAKVTKELTGWSVTITEVADGVTIDPAKTGIDKNAFEWTSLNLNAKMKDIDGSEKMHFTLKDLDSSAQFRVNNGDGTYTDLSSQAKFENGKWTINGIEAKDINSIEISHDKSVSGVKVEAWTVDGNVPTLSSVSGTFDLSYKADAKFDNGTFTLAKDMDIDFNNIGKLGFTNVEKIDLGAQGENKLLNLTLQDVLDMGKEDGSGNINLKILGNSDDKLTFADKSQWQKSDTPTFEGGKTFTEWSNTSGDSTVTLKIEQPISDGITN